MGRDLLISLSGAFGGIGGFTLFERPAFALVMILIGFVLRVKAQEETE
jgi:hypothetical protein